MVCKRAKLMATATELGDENKALLRKQQEYLLTSWTIER